MNPAWLAQIDRRNTLIIMSLLLIAIASALFSYALFPLMKNYYSITATKQTLIRAIDESHHLPKNLDSVRAETAELRKRLHGDMASLPIQQIESFIIGQLQTLAWKRQVELEGITPKKGIPIDQFNELLFDIKISGDYLDIYNFLADISTEMGFVVINHYRIIAKQRTDPPVLVVAITIAAYRIMKQAPISQDHK